MKPTGRILGLATELGVTMGLTAASLVVLALLLGRWLDARLGARGLATVVLVVGGAIAGQISIYRLAMRSLAAMTAGEPRNQPGREALSAVGLALRALALLTLPGLAGLALGLVLDGVLGIGALGAVALAGVGLVLGLFATVRIMLRARLPFGDDKPASARLAHECRDRDACQDMEG